MHKVKIFEKQGDQTTEKLIIIPNAENKQPDQDKPVENIREKSCPFLIKVFHSTTPPSTSTTRQRSALLKTPHILIHTWHNATILELASLIIPKLSIQGKCELAFKLVYTSGKGVRDLTVKDIGSVYNWKDGACQDKTLADVRFLIGDFIEVNILDEKRTLPPPPTSNNNNNKSVRGTNRYDPYRDDRRGAAAAGRREEYGAGRREERHSADSYRPERSGANAFSGAAGRRGGGRW